MPYHDGLGFIEEDRPAYRILNEKGFFAPNCHLYLEGDAIYFDGEPNEDMEPLNEMAHVKLKELFVKLDGFAEEFAKANGKKYAGRVRSVEEHLANSSMNARAPQLIKGGAGVPIMGATPKNATSVQPIERPEVPQTGQKRRGRPPGVRSASAAA